MLLSGGDNAGASVVGTAPLKFGREINVQNLVLLMTTFDFDHKYFWTGLRYQQVVNGVINRSLSHVEPKKNCEIWSTNTRDHVANVYLP